MPAVMGRLVMCGKKSREIQAPVLVIVTAMSTGGQKG